MKVLSLFDGMSCGMLAMLEAGVKVDRYVAYEIDKYAVRTSSHNFPMIEQRGDVFQADFTEFAGFDWLVGGSPCTYWSIAQTKNRETVASGIGWELFGQYVRALHEAKPKYFIYENNKSMSKAIRASIDETFGFEAVCINSALVSAQNRQRLYWVGKRNADGTYSKVNVEQPEDRGILLRDILENGVAWQEKSYNLTTRCCGAIPEDTLKRHRHTMVAEPIEPRCVAQRGRYPENPKSRVAGLPTEQMFEAREDSKTNTLTTVQKDNLVAEPVAVNLQVLGRKRNSNGEFERYYEARTDSKASTITTVEGRRMVAEPVCVGYNERMENGGSQGTKTKLYAIPVEFNGDVPIKAVSCADGKVYTVYEVREGLITIKGKQYPIKLKDGYYIIRKLTVRECMRLQTVPEWYEFPVSDSQAYKMLGNGWTVDVIAHILKGLKEAKKIPDINEPMCIPITNIQLEKMEELNGERKDGAD